MLYFYIWMGALLAISGNVYAQYGDAQAQAQQAYQTSRQNYIRALSQAGYNVSEYVLPATLGPANGMLSAQQLQSSVQISSNAANSVVGAITKEHRPMDYNNDKIEILRDRIRELQERYKPAAKSRLPEEVYRRQVREIQIRILNIVLSDKDSEIAKTQLAFLRDDPRAIIIDDPLLYPVEGQP